MINGGIINAYGTNARLGAGDWMVVEADESDGTFVQAAGDHGRSHQRRPGAHGLLRQRRSPARRLRSFLENIPFYGVAILCIDHPAVQTLIGRIEDRRVVTYGLSPQADVRGTNLTNDQGGSAFDVVIADRKAGTKPDHRPG